MADRYYEFKNKVKMILDKSDAERDARELASDLEDILKHTKIGFDANSLKELGELFNKKLKEFGQQPIVFSDIKISDNALKEITTRFTNAISDSIQAGIKSGVSKVDPDITKQLNKLKLDRQKLVEEYNQNKKLIANKTKMNKAADFDPLAEEHRRYTLKGDIIDHARTFIEKYQEAIKKFESTPKDSSKYSEVVLGAKKAYDDILFMRSELIKAQKKGLNIPKELRSPYNLTNRESNEIIRSDISYEVLEAFENINNTFNAAQKRIKEIKKEIEDIDSQISALENKSTQKTTSTGTDNERIVRKVAEETERQAESTKISADAAEREKKAKEETLKVEEKINKLLLYRIGKTTFNPNRFRNTDMMGNSVETRLDGFGGYGDGLFAVTKDAALDITRGDIKPGDAESYFEFDASKYNLYVNKTVEQAKALEGFSDKLQKFILASGDFRGFDDDIQGIDENSLFSEATKVFSKLNMSKEEFYTWITSMKKLVVDNGLDSSGTFSKADESFLNSRNFFTRFMQKLGYQGVLNDTGNDEIDGMAQGSVIYEPDFAAITEYIQSNEVAFKKVKDFLLYLTKSKEKTNEIIKYLNSTRPKSLTPIESFSDNIEGSSSVSSVQTTEEKTKTKVIKEQNEALKENLNLKTMVENATGGTHGQSVATASGKPVSENTNIGTNIQELEGILSRITYNVKIAKDDVDKGANKITLDDSTLKTTLQDVFKNIINSDTQQNDDKHLNILSSIQKAVESINKKIVQGTVVIKTGSKKNIEEKNVKPNIKKSTEDGYVKATKVDPRIKYLESKYNELGTLQGYNDPVKDVEAKILEEELLSTVERLEAEKVINATIKERLETIRLTAKTNQSEVEVAKQKKKDDQDNLRALIKRSKEENRVNTSTSVWNSGNKTLESLWKIDDKENPLELQSVKDLMAALKELNAVRQRVNENLRKGIAVSEADSNELSKKTETVTIHTEAVKKLISNYSALSGANVKETGRIINPNADIETQLVNAVRAFTDGQARIGNFDAATNKLKYTVKTGAYTFKEYEMAVRDAGGAIVSIQGETKRTETFFEGFKKKLGELTRYFSASSLIFKFFNEIRKGIQYIKEIDSALTELKKVTDETEETYDRFLDTASKTAAKVGSTIKDVISSTADWARLNI